MEQLDERITTTIDFLEVRAGIPRRVVFRAGVEENWFKSTSVANSNFLRRGGNPERQS